MKVSSELFHSSNTLCLAKELVGMKLCTLMGGYKCVGIINETEAYCGKEDKASHSYGGRRTDRTEIMYALGGVSYIYLCYGIHEMFNIVTGPKDDPQAILIRSVIPEQGIEVMMKRCNKNRVKGLTDGPGNLCKALSIHRKFSGESIDGPNIWLEAKSMTIKASEIITSPRIGVDYAGEDAALLYRFYWNGLNP